MMSVCVSFQVCVSVSLRLSALVRPLLAHQSLLQVFLHTARELPQVRDLGFAIPPGTHALVGVRLNEVRCSRREGEGEAEEWGGREGGEGEEWGGRVGPGLVEVRHWNKHKRQQWRNGFGVTSGHIPVFPD